MDSVGEGEGGMIWENDIETCIISYMKCLGYTDDTILMTESEEELKSLLMRVKEQSEKKLA